jgi:cytochrome c-type biogenesis protein CcmE
VSTGIKVALSVAVVLGGVVYMIATTVGSGEALEYYKHVDEVMSDPGRWRGRRLQLHGNVVAGSILKRKGSLDFKFAIHKNGKWVDVSYSGLVPDAFKDCAELVVKGKLGPDHVFFADSISAKCPSKYEGKLRKMGCGGDLLSAVLGQRGGG